MKVVILAGGLGTRLAEETEIRPKPMVEIGGRPILWHIMKHYAPHGFSEFFVAPGTRASSIKRYFLDYTRAERRPDDRHRQRARSSRAHEPAEDWTVHLIDTGDTTGHRRARAAPALACSAAGRSC